MGVAVTVRPHRVVDTQGNATVFDQYQILIGQRVVGYKAKEKGLPPKLIVRDLPEEAINAIMKACAKTDGLEPLGDAVLSHPIGNDPAKDPLANSNSDAAATAAIESAIAMTGEQAPAAEAK